MDLHKKIKSVYFHFTCSYAFMAAARRNGSHLLPDSLRSCLNLIKTLIYCNYRTISVHFITLKLTILQREILGMKDLWDIRTRHASNFIDITLPNARNAKDC